MTPEEELSKLNRLLHQYETVYRTTVNPDQRERVGRQIRELRKTKEKLLAVHAIDPDLRLEEKEEEEGEDLAPFPFLVRLRGDNAAAAPGAVLMSFAAKNVPPTSSQEEMFDLSLYVRFEREFLPFLTDKHLKLDFKFSMDRDAFYTGVQALQRSLADFREECRRLAEGMVSRHMERDVRDRSLKLTRIIAVEAAKFFRAVERFSSELALDATPEGTKCLNGDQAIAFDSVEGQRVLQGRRVREGLGDLSQFAAEVVSYLNLPEIEIQESERADRH